MARRPLPPLRLLTVFEAVLRAGNTQRAATELNVTQPAVSQSLKALESHVGVELFDRSVRPVALTEAGQVLRRGVLEGLATIVDAIDAARATGAAENLSVTIACSVGTATYFLMPRLAAFYAEYPEIAVNVMTTNGPPAFQGGVDLNIWYGLGDWKDADVSRLFEERVVPVCNPQLAATIGGQDSLTRATLLHVENSDRAWLTWDDYLELNGLAENRAVGRFFTNYVQATQAALAGQGVMLGWESNAGDLVREGRLVALNFPPHHPKEAFYIVTPHRMKAKKSAKILSEWLLSACAGE